MYESFKPSLVVHGGDAIQIAINHNLQKLCYVRSIIEYGCYISFRTQKMSMEKLEKIQHMAIRLALGYRMNVLLAESINCRFYKSGQNFFCASYSLKILSHKELLAYKNLIRFSKTKSKRLIKQCLGDVSKYSNIVTAENLYDTCRYSFEPFVVDTNSHASVLFARYYNWTCVFSCARQCHDLSSLLSADVPRLLPRGRDIADDWLDVLYTNPHLHRKFLGLER